MVGLDDVLLRDDSEGPAPLRSRGGRGVGWTVASVLVLVLLGAGAWRLLRRAEPRPSPAAELSPAVPAPPAAGPAPVSTPEPALPSLDASDALARDLARTLSSHVQFAAWLDQKQLIRKFVAILNNVAEGESPRPHLLFLVPAGGFKVIERQGVTVVDPEGYTRYDLIADVVESIHAEAFARVFASLLPLGEAADRELGHPRGQLVQTVQRALGEMLAVPANASAPPVVPFKLGPLTQYRYLDARLEALTPAQKNLLRMGPRNVTRIQARLRAVLAALDPLLRGASRPAASSPGV